MSSVWFEELSIGLINELKNTVQTKDEHGSLVYLPNNAFTIRKPEEDFMFETFPCVSAYLGESYKFNPIRYYPYPIKVGSDAEHNIAIMQDSAVPYDIDCQLDFWAHYQEDMDTMTKTWLMRHFRDFKLRVVDDGGIERMCNVSATEGIVKSDLISNGKRLFHSIMRYSIWVEIDDEIPYNKFMVNTVDITMAQSDSNKEEG